MPEDKKVVGASKLSLSEEMHLAFLNQCQRLIRRRLPGRFWRVYLKILATVKVTMWIVVVKIPKIDPDDQAMQFLVSPVLRKIILSI
jgi:hypothetical protein